MSCERCKKWSEEGLSDTCPACDLAKEDMKHIEEFESEARQADCEWQQDGSFMYAKGALESSVTRKLEEACRKTLLLVDEKLYEGERLTPDKIIAEISEALAELALLRSGK